jgi:hypothetical protein
MPLAHCLMFLVEAGSTAVAVMRLFVTVLHSHDVEYQLYGCEEHWCLVGLMCLYDSCSTRYICEIYTASETGQGHCGELNNHIAIHCG